MLYNKFENRTVVTGQLVAIDPVHIGASANDSLNPSDIDSHVLKDSSGNPIIPGSSIKGVIRSRFEAIMRSIDDKNVCDIFDDEDERCVYKVFSKELDEERSSDGEKLSDYEKAVKFYEKSCTVCKLFGGKAVAGKLRFKDCSFIGEKFAGEKRDGVGIDRDTGAASRTAKYDFEIIPKGSRFDFVLIAENLDEQQQKYLEFIIDMLEGKGVVEGDYLSFGGKTTRGLGRMRLENATTKTTSASDLKKQISEKYSL